MRLIDADALLFELDKLDIPFRTDINAAIKNAPTVHGTNGKWIPTYSGFYRCSHCSKVRYIRDISIYCPNCGAKMGGGEE